MRDSNEQNTRDFAANIRKYFLYNAFKAVGFGLFIATWVVYLQERRGLSLAQAALIDVTFFVAAAFGEIPTGVVADMYGRKTSILIGAVLMFVSLIGWAFLPTLPLIMLAYVAMGIGITFMSGADEALFYESVQLAGRGDDYPRLLGRAGMIFPAGLAVGSLVSGFLATIELSLPYIFASFFMLMMIGAVLTLKEPQSKPPVDQKPKSFRQVFGQSFALMRERPILRYPILYMALVPLASFIIEAVLLQPQALALGVPLAGLGVLVTGFQLTNMAASSLSERIKKRFGEARLLYSAPVIIITCVILLALLQTLPSLLLIAVMAFVTSVLRPIVMNRIQNEVSDDVRATVVSMQSLTFTFFAALAQPSLGFVADRSGLPTAYLTLACVQGLLIFLLLWKSRVYFPQPVPAPVKFVPQLEAEA
jgi:MFS family permease